MKRRYVLLVNGPVGNADCGFAVGTVEVTKKALDGLRRSLERGLEVCEINEAESGDTRYFRLEVTASKEVQP